MHQDRTDGLARWDDLYQPIIDGKKRTVTFPERCEDVPVAAQMMNPWAVDIIASLAHPMVRPLAGRAAMDMDSWRHLVYRSHVVPL